MQAHHAWSAHTTIFWAPTGPASTGPDSSRTAMAAVLELAASLCTARNPLCAQCPLHPQCEWARDPECAEALT